MKCPNILVNISGAHRVNPNTEGIKKYGLWYGVYGINRSRNIYVFKPKEASEQRSK